jgi:hypothetical protein
MENMTASQVKQTGKQGSEGMQRDVKGVYGGSMDLH